MFEEPTNSIIVKFVTEEWMLLLWQRFKYVWAVGRGVIFRTLLQLLLGIIVS